MDIHSRNDLMNKSCFSLLYELVSNQKIWSAQLSQTNDILPEMEISKCESLEFTSCTLNAVALSLLFLGKEKTAKAMPVLKDSSSEIVETTIGPIMFHHLQSGLKHLGIVPDFAFYFPRFKDFSDYCNRISLPNNPKTICLESPKAEDVKDINYVDYGRHAQFPNMFNFAVIERLESDMRKNKTCLSKNASFLYTIALTIPDLTVLTMTRTQIENLKPSSYRFWHLFHIEQSEKTPFRVHSAWQNHLSLHQYYDEAAEDEFAEDEKVFFSYFKKMMIINVINGVTPPKFRSDLTTCIDNCFYVIDDSQFVPGFLSFDKGFFTGLSVRYTMEQFNPEDIKKKIIKLLNPQL